VPRHATSVVRDRGAIDALTREWDDLHRSTRSGNPFAHPAWCTAWIDAFAPAAGRIVVHRDASGALDAVVPLAAARGGRRWTTLGAPLVDCGEPVLAARDDRATALLRLLARCRRDWDRVTLVGLAPDLARALVLEASGTGLRCRVAATETCPRIEVPSLQGWLDALPRGRGKRLRAARRRLERLAGFGCHERRTPDELGDAVRRFESLRLQSWWQRGGFRRLPRPARGTAHADLLHAAVTSPLAVGDASVVELVAGGRLLASSVLFWTADAVLVALKATDTRTGSALSPGTALDVSTIELAAARGVASVGFGRGDEGYKFWLGARAETTVDVVVGKGIRYRRTAGPVPR
jgi:CelD/BcsL family acetyltransferase involved in cellulose biosynthesis